MSSGGRTSANSLSLRGTTSKRRRNFSGLPGARDVTTSPALTNNPNNTIVESEIPTSLDSGGLHPTVENATKAAAVTEGPVQEAVHVSGSVEDVDETAGMTEEIPVQEPAEDFQAAPFSRFDPLSLIRCMLILCAWLHCQHHVSFQAIWVLLWAIGFVFSVLPGNILGDAVLPKTLKTVFARLDILDRFKIYPICPFCHSIFPAVSPTDSKCPNCDAPIYRSRPKALLDRLQTVVTDDPDDNGDPTTHPTSPSSHAHVVAPILLLSGALEKFFERPGMVDAVREWKTKPRSDEKLESIQDGEVWKNLKAADGSRFFYDEEENELRIGVSLGIDWFGRKSSNYGPSHSSGVVSFCIQNLNSELRYRPENLIVTGMLPGPTEPTSAQLQNYSKIIVDDLIKLYEDGITVTVLGFPNGFRVRVALISIIADHPAMCKICGFADHGHKIVPCPKCKVPKADMFTGKSLKNGFQKRTSKEHRKLALQYRDLITDEERDTFFAEHGVTKTQWYTMWIKEKILRPDTNKQQRELSFIHEILETFECPAWTGHLPLRVGEPAGGSLTADEYKFAATAPWAIIIPMVWDRFRSDAEKDHKKALDKYEEKMEEYRAKYRLWQRQNRATRGDPPEEPEYPVLRMQLGEEDNFLCFATALKIMIGSSIYREMIPRAKSLLEEYLLGFLQLYGSQCMKPNHHWAVHVFDQIRDFGPFYSFWAFLTERLNKTLKNLNSNNWTGGRLEVSMMREFQRGVQLETAVTAISYHDWKTN
ncbi:unnamed protein product [Mycena citricolor]|uniref:Uncharacterized protein n=1 Tax=Mycena citricolor TaxID=2018698 RepID=A0AAD2GRY2_9AGAR|nr:unnamed protein product [Mycena citricolor]